MTNEEVKEEKRQLELEKARWKNRRRMAWISLISIITVTATLLFTDIVSEEKIKVMSEIITWFYFACASVIGAYMGFTTWSAKK